MLDARIDVIAVTAETARLLISLHLEWSRPLYGDANQVTRQAPIAVGDRCHREIGATRLETAGLGFQYGNASWRIGKERFA
jgi:hypothetical protein